jgi:CSN8/PSMD8/EIF3K family
MVLNRLLDFKTQERYYTKIVDRYMSFCSKAGRGDELLRRLASLTLDGQGKGEPLRDPATATTMSDSVKDTDETNETQYQKDLSVLIMSMRKLREGIVASHRVDEFSIQAYLFCIRLSILVKHMESYHPALLYLLRHMHKVRPLTKIDLQEFVGYLVLDLACRQQDLAQAYAVRIHYSLRDSKVDAVLSALVHDNYHLFWKVKRSVDGHKAKLMEFIESSIRIQALKCLGRTYFSIDTEFLQEVTNTSWPQLVTEHKVGWELDGEKVIIRKPKSK